MGYPCPGSFGTKYGVERGLEVITLESPYLVADERGWLEMPVGAALVRRSSGLTVAIRVRQTLLATCDGLSHCVAMRSPWWQGLDLRVLRHVRGVLRRRGLELTLVERRPTEPAAFAPLIAGRRRRARGSR